MIGPGLGSELITSQCIIKVVRSLQKDIKVIVDADALTIIKENKLTIKENWILTPHPKEFDRLFDTKISKAKNNSDRKRTFLNVVKKYKAVIILKGHKTLVGSEDQYYTNLTGNNIRV